MEKQQKIDYKNHHKAKSILLSVISKMEYKKITNKDTAHDILESLKMSYEGNAQVEEAEALVTWDDSESSNVETDSEDEHANLAFKATPAMTLPLTLSQKRYFLI